MSQTNQQQPKVDIYQDGKLLKTFTGPDCETSAFGYVLRVQPQSVDYALRYGGYRVISTDETGKETAWKHYTSNQQQTK